MSDASDAGILLTRDGAVATLTLNRPAALNALDLPMMDMLVRHTAALAEDGSVRLVIVRGAGRHFMAGGDLRAFSDRLETTGGDRRAKFSGIVDRLHAAVEHLQRMPHPVLGVVRGAVAGFGLSLACACDLVIATGDAYFSSAYRHVGLTPDGGGTWALPRIVGLRKAMEIHLLSERFDAREAERLGIVNRVVDESQLDATVAAWSMTLATGPRLALQNVKRLLRDSLDHTLSQQLHAEAQSFGQCAATGDFAEGLSAFFDKRRPQFD